MKNLIKIVFAMVEDGLMTEEQALEALGFTKATGE